MGYHDNSYGCVFQQEDDKGNVSPPPALYSSVARSHIVASAVHMTGKHGSLTTGCISFSQGWSPGISAYAVLASLQHVLWPAHQDLLLQAT